MICGKPSQNPSPKSRPNDETGQAAFNDALGSVDISGSFKRNGLSIKLDDTDDPLVSNKLKLLVWDEMTEFRVKLLSTSHPSLKDWTN